MRFRKRALLTAVVLAMAANAALMWSVMTQRRVVSQIRMVGGTVAYDREYEHYNVTYVNEEHIPQMPPPGRIEQFLGSDMVQNVAAVYLIRYSTNNGGRVEHKVRDEFLDEVTKLKHIRLLNVIFQPITDAGLLKLEALRRIEELQLYGTNVTDQSISTMLRMPSLRIVDIGGTGITASGIKRLEKLPKLEMIYLSNDQLAGFGGWEGVHAFFDRRSIRVAQVHNEPGGGGSVESR